MCEQQTELEVVKKELKEEQIKNARLRLAINQALNLLDNDHIDQAALILDLAKEKIR